ncbi:MAG TPA: zf-HC2 domain-containing protein [Gemmatimonadales bacterium]|nr:zf-HC2 domain-containing protein [Gemmatimonadales bacterium]
MTTLNHLTEREIAGYLDDNLDAPARAGMERHLEHCPECRAELIAVMELAADRPSPAVKPARWRQRWIIPAACAAGLALVVLVRPRGGASLSESERPSGLSESLPRIAVTAPANGTSVRRDALLLGWRSRPGESYQVTILTESGEPLWHLETTDTAVSVPGTVALVTGKLYFWRVDAVADGRSASSGVRQFQVVP